MNLSKTTKAFTTFLEQVITYYKEDLSDGESARNRTGALRSSFKSSNTSNAGFINGQDYAKHLKTGREYQSGSSTNQGFLNEGLNKALLKDSDELADAFAEDALNELTN